MKLSTRSIIYIGLVVLAVWIVYLGREVLTPFVLAAVFAYLLDPVVSFISDRAKFSRSLAILTVYVGVIVLLVVIGFFLERRLAGEVREFASEARAILTNVEAGKSDLPPFLAPYVTDLSTSLKHSISFSSQQIIRFFSGAISTLFEFFIFILVLFYFLREGRGFLHFIEAMLPGENRIEFAIVLRKVNQVLGNYLRAQFLLVTLMATVFSLVFLIVGVRYALILGLIIGLAELVPIVGPVVALLSVVFVTLVSGGAAFLEGVPLIYHPLIVGLIYVVGNQLENVLLVPKITGKMVQLHPLLILASVLVGGQLFGAVGFLLAVPVVASAKVIFTHILDLLD